MRMIFGAVLIIGIALAGFAVHMTQNYVESHKAALANARSQTAPVVPTTPVFVAKRRLAYGDEITLDDIVVAQWPSNALPKGVFSQKEKLFPADKPGKRYVMRATEKFEAILAVKITKPGQEVGLNARLEPGQRAFTIKVDVSSGVSGFLRPGDKVDVYWTGNVQNSGGSGQRTVSKLIEAGVKIIAIDQSSNEEQQRATIARTATVAIGPEQVASLALAQSTGRLALSLVGHRDETVSEVVEVDQQQLLGIQQAQPVVEAKAEKVCTIRTRKGAEVVNIPIPCTN